MLALFLVVGLGSFLRFHALDRYGLWLDEAWLAAYSKLSVLDILSGVAREQWLILLALKITGLIAGYSETSMRFVPAVAGSLLIPTSFFLAKRFISTRGSVVVAGLVALSPMAIAYSQESANYSLMILATTLSLLFVVEYAETRSRKALVLFAVAAFAGVNLHVYSALIVIAVVAYFYAIYGFDRRYRDFYLSIAGLALASLYRISSDLHTARLLKAVHARDRIAMPAASGDQMYESAKNIIMSWFQGPGGFYTPQSPYAFMRTYGASITIVLLCLFAASIAHTLVFRKKDHILLITLVILTHLCGILCMGYISGNVVERYALPLLPLCFILFVRAFYCEGGALIQKMPGNLLVLALLANFGAMQFARGETLQWKGRNRDWRGMCKVIRADLEHSERKQYAIFVPYNVEATLVDFYLPDLSAHMLVDSPYHSYLHHLEYMWSSFDEVKQFNLEILQKAKQSPSDVIYVTTLRGRSYMKYVDEFLADQFYLDKTTWTGTPWLYVYRRKVGRRGT